MPRSKAGYHDANGRPLPGTTTICGMLAKPALVGWAGKTCTAAAWEIGKRGDAMPQWTDLLYGQRDDAAAAGTLCHELAEIYVKGDKLPPIPDTEVGRRGWQAFENFVHWLDSSSLKLTAHERPLVSAEYGYGGTPDATAINGNTEYVLDYKTASGFYVEVVLQMAAYRQLLHEVEGRTIAGAHVLRFDRETGDFTHKFLASDALDQGWEVFRRLLDCYPLLKELEKRVK